MNQGAEILVRTCAGVKKGESIVIVTDEQRLAIGQAIRMAAINVEGQTVLVVSPTRSIDNEEPTPPVAVAIKAADVVFLPVTHALAHTRANLEAIIAGARVVSMTAFTEQMMRSGGLFTDFRKNKTRPVCDNFAKHLTLAACVKVCNPAGTDLTLNLRDRKGNSHCCILERPGFTAVPNIESNIAPLEGTTEGVLVADGSIPYYGIGVLREPVIFEIHKGFDHKISGGEQAKFLHDLLAAQKDPNVYNIAQFAIGLNPGCKKFTGEMLNDEGMNGTIHIGIGTSANLGGHTQAKTHFDAIFRKPSVWFDEELLIFEGQINVHL